MFRKLRTTAAVDEMVQGYDDGLHQKRDELFDLTRYSQAYVHGWYNGRDDRRCMPRAPASVLRQAGHRILKGADTLQ